LIVQSARERSRFEGNDIILVGLVFSNWSSSSNKSVGLKCCELYERHPWYEVVNFLATKFMRKFHLLPTNNFRTAITCSIIVLSIEHSENIATLLRSIY
jgi:hypothetical protein